MYMYMYIAERAQTVLHIWGTVVWHAMAHLDFSTMFPSTADSTLHPNRDRNRGFAMRTEVDIPLVSDIFHMQVPR